jgi:hypothetical protein
LEAQNVMHTPAILSQEHSYQHPWGASHNTGIISKVWAADTQQSIKIVHPQLPTEWDDATQTLFCRLNHFPTPIFSIINNQTQHQDVVSKSQYLDWSCLSYRNMISACSWLFVPAVGLWHCAHG